MTGVLFTVGDTAVDFTATCLNGSVAANLAGVTDVEVHFRRGDRSILTKDATVADAAAGKIRCEWVAGDLNSSGSWDVEVQVTYSNGDIQTFPAGGFSVRQQIA